MLGLMKVRKVSGLAFVLALAFGSFGWVWRAGSLGLVLVSGSGSQVFFVGSSESRLNLTAGLVRFSKSKLNLIAPNSMIWSLLLSRPVVSMSSEMNVVFIVDIWFWRLVGFVLRGLWCCGSSLYD